MRVVLVTSYTPPLVGGLERITATVARGLVAAGHQAAIVGQLASGRMDLRERFVRGEPVRTFRDGDVAVSIVRPRWHRGVPGALVYATMWVPSLRLPAAFLLGGARRVLVPFVRGADVVHYLGTGTETLGFAAAAAAREASAALVVQPAIHPGIWGDRPLDAELYRRADAVLAFTRGEGSLVEGLGVDPDRIRLVPGSIDPPPVTDPAGFRRRRGISGPMVLFLGRKTEDKGIGRLLGAWPAIRTAVPTATLVLVGPAADAATLAAAHAAGVVDIVDASDGEKHDALAACDLLCMPSVGESFGIAVFEAASHGKPVVVADVPALRETVGAAGAGLLVRPESGAVAEAVVSLLVDARAREAMGQCGRALAAGHSHDRALERYLAAYEAVLHRPTGAG